MRANAVRAEDAPLNARNREDSTRGNLEVRRASALLGTDQVQVNVIVFEPGSRFLPHDHPYDQVLYYVRGTGVVALDGGEDQIVPAGELVLLPAGVVHMHGATDEGEAVHLSIMRATEPGVETTNFNPQLPASWSHWRA